MGLHKAAKFELEILCENTLSMEEIQKWIVDAMSTYCDFDGCSLKLIECHDNVLSSLSEDQEATA
jgi:hypothetical protein